MSRIKVSFELEIKDCEFPNHTKDFLLTGAVEIDDDEFYLDTEVDMVEAIGLLHNPACEMYTINGVAYLPKYKKSHNRKMYVVAGGSK